MLGRTAFILDEAWPEFRTYVEQRRAQGDRIGIPLDGNRWNKPRYAWSTEGFDRPVTATAASLSHALLARRTTANGQRVAAQLRRCEAVARQLASTLTPDVTEVCVAQSLLPFLWRMGVLGGRRVTVLMTRMPMQQLQARLDRAAKAHPDRATLADFRAPAELVAAETEALAAAERIVTPHALVASQFPGKAELLDWHMPGALKAARTPKRRSIVFPGPSIARKGAHEVRALALRLDLEVVLLGGDLEGEGFLVRPAGAPCRPQRSRLAARGRPRGAAEPGRRAAAQPARGPRGRHSGHRDTGLRHPAEARRHDHPGERSRRAGRSDPRAYRHSASAAPSLSAGEAS